MKIFTTIEKNNFLICFISFVLGIFMTRLWPSIGDSVSNGVGTLLNFYGYVVPFLLYFLVAPALIKIFDLSEKYGNGWLMSVMRQFILARFFAILFSIVALTLIFNFPFYDKTGEGFGQALISSLTQLAHSLFLSPFLWGIYAAVATVFASQRIIKVKNFFNKVGSNIEMVGQCFMILSPLFMFAIGSFLYHLPFYLQESLGDSMNGISLNLKILFIDRLPERYQFVGLYFGIGLLTGIFCIAWHFLYILYTKIIQPKFRLRNYFKNYWIKVYPLLWSSSSESLAVPLSLSLVKKTFPYIPTEIRQFVIAGGSYLGINGTLISVYVMGFTLAKVLGVTVSFTHALFSLPVIFILGYAVPGIPGELIIFAGVMGKLLHIPPEALGLFTSLYMTLQIGLPDSFRTGCNSTDSALVAIMSSCRITLSDRRKLSRRFNLSLNLFKRNFRKLSYSYQMKSRTVNLDKRR